MSEAPSREAWRPDHRHIPHSRAIGMRMVETGGGVALMCVPYDRKLVGNPATGVLHGGVITSVLDSASGAAVGSALAARAEGHGRLAADRDARPAHRLHEAGDCRARICWRAPSATS